MAVPPVVSNTIAIWRFVRNAGTGQSALTEVSTNVPAYIYTDRQWKPGQMAAEVLTHITVDYAVDLRDGDQITGYNPLGLANPPTVQVDKVFPFAAPGMPQFAGVRTGLLTVLGPNNG